MQTIRKNLALFIGGLLLATLVIANGATLFAAEVPTQPDPTECTDCQTIQDDLDAAYADLAVLEAEAENYSTMAESLLNQATTTIYGGDAMMMSDLLTSEVGAGHLASGTACEDSSDTFAYYSSFTYDGMSYCVLDEEMWYGVEPDYFNFFLHMIELNDIWDPPAAVDWQLLWDDWIEVLYDHDQGGEDGLTEAIDIIISLLSDLEDCEDTNCPAEPECPDCESIADDLELELDNLADLEDEAETLDQEISDLEDELDTVFDQLDQWEQLKAEFEAMVEDAGGMHGEDCDNFEVQSGQAWGIAHNFGNVQWCFTSEGQIEEMIQNLDEYWETHSSQHLPSEAALNEQLDDLITQYDDKLAELEAVLELIDQAYDDIEQLMEDLEDCLDELEALQDLGYCLEQDAAAMRSLLGDSQDDLDDPWQGGDEGGEEDTGEEEEEGTDEGPSDIGGHWGEDFMQGLYDEDIMTGDGDTGLMRPNDELNRAEAAKLLVLASGDVVIDSFFDVFFDVTEDSWFWPFVNTAADLEYFQGYPDGSFGPGNSILRAEAIAVVLRALGFDIPEYDTYSYSDITGDEWFADPAEKAYQCGLVEGRNGAFEGGETITRAEIAKILWLAFFEGLMESDCADFECPDCDAVWAELEALGTELDDLDADITEIWDQMQELEALRDAFRQMVENAGGMTDADCDGFEVQSGQAWGVAHNFGDVQWCLTSESQITELTNQLSEYWENNSSSHLPSEETLNEQMDEAATAYADKLDEWLEKLAEYDECLADLEALQADGYCLDE